MFLLWYHPSIYPSIIPTYSCTPGRGGLSRAHLNCHRATTGLHPEQVTTSYPAMQKQTNTQRLILDTHLRTIESHFSCQVEKQWNFFSCLPMPRRFPTWIRISFIGRFMHARQGIWLQFVSGLVTWITAQNQIKHKQITIAIMLLKGTNTVNLYQNVFIFTFILQKKTQKSRCKAENDMGLL